MIPIELIFAVVSSLILFLYGIEHFSGKIQQIAGGSFRALITRATSNRFSGALLGAISTAITQSSTAITVITVSLVNSGTISFAQSLGIIIGANVGTTVTAQLVAFRLTTFGPVFIVLGFLLDLLGGRKYKFLGKPIFYFGLVFFALNLMSTTIAPLQDDPAISALFSYTSNVFIALLAGILLTVLFQSSSVTTGLIVVFSVGGFLTLGQAIPLLLGANIGTTATALVASSGMSLFARRAGMAHFLFNVGGALIFLPFLGIFAAFISSLGGTVAQQVANAHLIFNLVAAGIFLAAINPLKTAAERLVSGEEKEILLETKYLGKELPKSNAKAFSAIEKELGYSLDIALELLNDSMDVLETVSKELEDKVIKLEFLNDFLDERIEAALLELSRRKLSEQEALKTVLLVRISNAIERIGDSGKDIAEIAVEVAGKGRPLKPELASDLRECYDMLQKNISLLRENFPAASQKIVDEIRANDNELRRRITKQYQDQLSKLEEEGPLSDSTFLELLSIIESLNSKNREIRKLLEQYPK